uniref:GDSL esterase/lipase n=1 Tax=Ananas comosus var. bracteatus TaxID=296719 RepID=A0A6V7QC02_ANACO|nr:unnamed protein product [Ananas comosus var. bracteatus]
MPSSTGDSVQSSTTMAKEATYLPLINFFAQDVETIMSVIPLWKQVEFFKEYQTRLVSYLGVDSAKETISEAVYAISIATNDFIENYFAFTSTRFLEFTVDEYEDYLVGLTREFIIEIYNLGARKIGFTGMSAMGCLPMERSRNFMLECVQDYNKVARDFNTKVQAMCEELGATLPGIQLKVAQLYDYFLHIIQNPSLYGFENVEVGCCATGLFEMGFLCNQWSPFTCTDATKYAFWDAVHPTEKMSRIIADYLLNTTFLHFI